MYRKSKRSGNQFALGVICLAIGVGMLFACLLTALAPIFAIAFIAVGIWLIYKNKKHC